MAQRLDRFQQRRASTRNLLEWLGVSAAGVIAALALTCNARAAEPDVVAGLMLRPGVQADGVDGDVASLPTDGWYRVTHKAMALQVQAVAAPVSAPGEEEAEAVDTRYIRVPGTRIAEGLLPTVAFRRGILVPRIDHTYQLALGDAPFTLTVSNGLRTKAGVAYGQGAVYTVHIDDQSYSFHLDGGAGWESVILAAADLDSDGKPDFIVQIGGQEVLLLSSQTQPGLNPPAAVLALMVDGC